MTKQNYSNVTTIKEMQIKNTLATIFLEIKLAFKKKKKHTPVWARLSRHSHIQLVEVLIGKTFPQGNLAIYKNNFFLSFFFTPFGPVILLLAIYCKEIIRMQTKISVRGYLL